MKASICLAILLWGMFTGLVAQEAEPLLNRRVSLSASATTLEDALLLLAEKGHFSLSYNAALLPTDSVVSFRFQNQRIKAVLSVLLPPDIDMRTSGNHLVLLKKVRKKQEARQEKIVLTGTILNLERQYPLVDALVFDVSGLQSALTDSAGNFQLVFPNPYDRIALSISRKNYRDTVLLLSPNNQHLNILLLRSTPNVQVEDMPANPFAAYNLGFATPFIAPALVNRANNLEGYISRPFQLSLLPVLGTNLKMGGLVNNQYSLNLLGGYGYGVQKAELGGVFNVNRAQVHGLQLAGAFNFTGGSVTGAQVAVGLNRTGGNQRGVQMSGGINQVKGHMSGVQVAGLINNTQGPVNGFGLAGVVCYSGDSLRATQIGGVLNVVKGPAEGFQLAGLTVINASDTRGMVFSGAMSATAGDFQGVQFAGAFNIAHNAGGVQASGGLNWVRDTLWGIQAAPFNYAKNLKGRQFGVINFADTASGVPIGVISIVRKGGYFSPEFSVSELLFGQVAVKLGVKRFYNIFSVGAGWTKGSPVVGYGLGFGWEKALRDRRFLDYAFSHHWVQATQFTNRSNAYLSQAKVQFGKLNDQRMALAFGPTINVLFTGMDSWQANGNTSLAPYYLLQTQLGNARLESWIGLNVAVHW